MRGSSVLHATFSAEKDLAGETVVHLFTRRIESLSERVCASEVTYESRRVGG
jgi:hypothetical protein